MTRRRRRPLIAASTRNSGVVHSIPENALALRLVAPEGYAAEQAFFVRDDADVFG
jgi:hypothetical protein